MEAARDGVVTPMAPRLRVALLGPLELIRDGQKLEPPSPKQRALLINLVLHRGAIVGRDRLIDDLWGEDPPATAKGVVQNYVSQLRRALGADVVRTAGQGYGVAVEQLTIDVDDLEAWIRRARDARDAGDVDAVRQATADALALFRGEPLADVAFESFARAEITRLGELHAVLLELQLEAEISGGRHQEAVAQLEAAVVDHPLHERLWWLLMLALYRSGRHGDALRAYQRVRGVLADELGLDPGLELRDLERAILGQRAALDDLLVPVQRRRRIRRTPRRTSLVGRAEEWSAITGFLERDERGRLFLLVGEPGIGKTRLLEEAQAHVESGGGLVIVGRAFEAEQGRPYGAWADALRATPLPELDAVTRAGLAPLLPELSDTAVRLDDPKRLYDAVVGIIDTLADATPVAVLLDDAHWLDEPSVSLLHFAIRHLADADVSFLAAARPAELVESGAVSRLMQALRRDGTLTELPIGPLPPASIAELTESIVPGADSQRITEATNGNPLFALEMARAFARGDEPLTSRVDALIGDRLARLDASATALVPWIAAFGRGVEPRVLARLVERDVAELFDPVGELERHGVVEARPDGSIDFVHDLVRSAAYKRLSTPRQSMLHARIGKVLSAVEDPDDSLAAESARHADLGSDSTTCAAACARAARRCLRLLAYPDAETLVALGRSHAPRLPMAQRVSTELELIHVLLHPGVRLRDPGELARDLSELCAEAQRQGLAGELSRGLSLLARAYHWGWGDIPRARLLMQRAAQLIEQTSEPNLEPLLEGARCLAYLEMDMERTARLFDELGTLHALADHSIQYQWGLGLVQAWRGQLDAARTSLGRAIELADARGDHWASFECTARLALLQLEAGGIDDAAALCAQLPALAAKLGAGSEQPYAAGIIALHAIANHDPRADAELDDAVVTLERIDARFLVPDLLGIAAELHQRAGKFDPAKERAARALEVANQVARPFEAARAHALLACIAADIGEYDDARRHLAAASEGSGTFPGHVEGLHRQAALRLQARPTEKGADEWP